MPVHRIALIRVLSKVLMCAWCMVFSGFPTIAQDEYSFITYTSREGLSSTDISVLFQDSWGYLWVGHSAGVSRFNGRKFENYFSDNQVSAHTYCIAESKNGYILVGTENGLYLAEERRLLQISSGKVASPVYSIQQNQHGDLWLGTSEGPVLVSLQDLTEGIEKRKLSFHVEPGWLRHFGGPNPVVTSSLASDGSVFFGDGYEVVRFYSNQMQTVWKSSRKGDQLICVLAISKDSAFIATTNGLFVYSPTGLRKITEISDRIAWMIADGTELILYTSDKVVKFNPSTSKITSLFMLPESLQKWGSSILKIDERGFWLSTHERLAYVKRKNFSGPISQLPVELNELYSIYAAKDGRLFCGTHRGNIFVSDTGRKTFVKYNQPFLKAPIVSLSEHNDELWASSWFEGIAKFSKNGVEIFDKTRGLRDNSNFVFLKTRDAFFTAGDGGASLIKTDSSGKISFKNFRALTGLTNYPVIKSAISTNSGQIFFGSNYGLFTFSGDSLLLVQITNAGNRNFNITDMRIDVDGKIWVATLGAGVLICEAKGNDLVLLRTINEDSGLLSNLSLQLLIDRKNQIWVGSYSGISKIEQDFSIMNLPFDEEFSDLGFHHLRLALDVDDRIWLATSSGLFSFDEKTVLQSKPVLNLISGVTTSDSSVVGNKTNLAYNQNSIAFTFDLIQFGHPQIAHYQYRLSNQDTVWRSFGENGVLMLQNLSSGYYKLEVRGRVGESEWSDVHRIEFNITSPFWKTWWFIALVVTFGIGLFALLMKWRLDILRRNSEKKARVQQEIRENLEHRLEMEQVINYFATSIAGKETEEALLWDVAQKCIGTLGFEDCVIYLLDKNRNVLVQKAALGPKSTNASSIVNPIEIEPGSGIVGSVALSGKAEIVDDTNDDERYLVDDTARRSEIAVPIVVNGEVTGVIDSENSLPGFYTYRHLQILKTIASLCADKIELIRTSEQKKSIELESFRNYQRATRARLESMKLQMNPHFLFNSLNSIQQMILAGDERIATRALSKFSKLLRTVLVNSDRERISLSEELHVLTLYVELESLRFADTFSYSINCDDAIDTEEVFLPPLLVQPFVENAIWHGLLHKEGIRRLDINFRLVTSNSLCCEIRDNGIGREASARMKTTNSSFAAHTGKGISTTRERLTLFEEQMGEKCEVEITDVENGGTRVVLIIPI